MTPPVTPELIARLNPVSGRWWKASMRQVPGSELRSFGGAIACAVPARADLFWMNMVVDFGVDEVPMFEEILHWYRSLGLSPTFEVAPLADMAPLGEPLVRAGFVPTVTSSVLYGDAVAPVMPDGVRVLPVVPELLDVFNDLRTRGFDIPEDKLEQARGDSAGWLDVPGAQLFIAEIDGNPAGVGALHVQGDVGYLANASTVPELRGRGAHSALIARRMQVAADAGCTMISGLAILGSQSQNNMERAGLRIACTRALWREPTSLAG